MTGADPITLADWRRAYDGGADPFPLLAKRVSALRADDPAWILRCEPSFVAAQLDALPPRGASTPLWGVPFAVKDNIDVAGLPTTAGCPAFAYQPTASAEVVRRLQAAGAILIGKTNLDQFATGLVGTRSPYGEVPNTFNPAFISGGSSSGSASVVARGLAVFALGTDTAGSGRVPAALNNLIGFKPTPGRVPMRGVVPACRSLDVVSVFALTVADAAQVSALIEGHDEPRFMNSAPAPAWLGGSRVRPRLGVPARPGCDAALGWDRAFDAAVNRARALGADLEVIDFEPLFDVARLLYEGPWVAERKIVVQALLAAQPDALDPVVAQVIGGATEHDAAAAFAARYRLEELRAQIAPIWRSVDALLVPTVTTCPTRAAVAAAPIARNSELGRYTNFVNLLGLAAIALPCMVPPLPHPLGLPFGVTLIAPGGSDAALIDWALRWEAAGPMQLGARLRAAADPDRTPLARPAAAETVLLAVVGAHLRGLPLHDQLLERGARLCASTRTAPIYRLHALAHATPPKPGLSRVGTGEIGHRIEVELYEMPLAQFGSFVALVPPPLAIGSVQLDDGRWVKGFVCEAAGLAGARDVSGYGGWRAWLAASESTRP